MSTDSDHQTGYLLKRLLREYITPYWKKLVWASLAMVVVAAMTAANAWMMQPALDKIFLEKDQTMLWVIPIAVLVVAIIKGIASYIQSVIMKFVGQRIVADIQLHLYTHLLHADLSLLQQYSAGKLISRFAHDINSMRVAVSTALTSIVKETLTIIFLVSVMFYQSAMLSILALGVFPLAIYPILKLGRKMRHVAHTTQESLGDYTTQLDETFQGVRVIKAYGQEGQEVSRARQMMDGIVALYLKAARIQSAVSPMMETISGLAIAIVIFYGGLQVIESNTTPGGFFSFIAALIMAYKPVKTLADLHTNLQEGLAAAKRVFAVLDVKPEIEDAPDAKTLSCTQAAIQLQDVSFRFHEEAQILNQLSLTIPAGKTIALVGPSGGGKSTIMNMLLRFYDPQSGQITINDESITKYTLVSLRDHISFVGQETFLFDDTIAANIAYGTENATHEMIEHAAKQAAAHEFIIGLPNQYETTVGPGGNALSGGQRQRIAIARAMLRNSPILLLDEATSALDSISEKHIQDALSTLRAGRTTIIIAHRLSTIMDADIIYVIDKGQVTEQGSHEELLAQQGTYASLYASYSS